jgi:hypothetical protein
MVITSKKKKIVVAKIDKAINQTSACLMELTTLRSEIEKTSILIRIK